MKTDEQAIYMLVRNRVADFGVWHAVFVSHAEAQRAAGLHLEQLWHDADDPNEVFFLLRVDDREKAEAFIAAPESARAGENSGVLDGEYHYVVTVD